MCSMSKRRRNDCRQRSTSASVASVLDHHSRTGSASPPLGRILRSALPGGDQAFDYHADPGGGRGGDVLARPEPYRVQDHGPRAATGLQCGDDRVGPARHHPVHTLAPPVGTAEGPARAGVRIRPQPRRDVDREHDPPVRGPRQRQPNQRVPQPGGVDPALVDRTVQRSVPTTVLRREREPDQCLHRPVGAQHRIGQLEQRITATGQAAMELVPELRQLPERLNPFRPVRRTRQHGLRPDPSCAPRSKHRIRRGPPTPQPNVENLDTGPPGCCRDAH